MYVCIYIYICINTWKYRDRYGWENVCVYSIDSESVETPGVDSPQPGVILVMGQEISRICSAASRNEVMETVILEKTIIKRLGEAEEYASPERMPALIWWSLFFMMAVIFWTIGPKNRGASIYHPCNNGLLYLSIIELIKLVSGKIERTRFRWWWRPGLL